MQDPKSNVWFIDENLEMNLRQCRYEVASLGFFFPLSDCICFCFQMNQCKNYLKEEKAVCSRECFYGSLLIAINFNSQEHWQLQILPEMVRMLVLKIKEQLCCSVYLCTWLHLKESYTILPYVEVCFPALELPQHMMKCEVF